MTNAIITQTATINAGDYAIVERGTNDERLVTMWLQSGKRGNSPLTQDSYLRTWRQFSESVGKPLQSITLGDLQDWRSHLTGKPATQKTRIATVRSLFSFAVKVGYLRMSPAVMLESPQEAETTHRRTVTQGSIERIVEACVSDRESALLRCLYSSGARISEVLSIKWQDVTPRENGGAILHIVKGKGRKSRRAGISADTYAALLRLRGDASTDAYVFATRTGAALDRQAAHKMIKRVLKRAGLPEDISAHWLRHSHATHVLQRGGNIADLQKQLGHSSLATTSRYAHETAFSADALAI